MSENQSKSFNTDDGTSFGKSLETSGIEESKEKDDKGVSGIEEPGEGQDGVNRQTLGELEENKEMKALEKEMANLIIKEKSRYVVRLRGLPWSAREKNIKEFFKDEKILHIQVVFLPNGKASGEAFVEFETLEDFQSGCSKHEKNLGTRYVEIFKATDKDIDMASGRIPRAFAMPKTQHIVRMRGLPYEATEEDVRKFFSDLKIAEVHLMRGVSGRLSGEGFVEFLDEGDVVSAMSRHRHNMGRRYIELFPSGRDELTKMLGLNHKGSLSVRKKDFQSQKEHRKSSDSRTTQISSNCLFMRGLPFSCNETDITKFFQDIDITPLRIHRKADGSEAYVEFCSIEDCSKAMTRNKHFIGSRYVELFRVTYEDMAQTVGLSLSQQTMDGASFQPMARNVNSVSQGFGFMPGVSQARTQHPFLSGDNTQPQQFYSQLLTQYPVSTDTTNSSFFNPQEQAAPTFFR